MAPPIRCDFHQEIIKPIDTPIGKNENNITSKVDLKVAGSGTNNCPIKAKPMNARLNALHVFAFNSN